MFKVLSTSICRRNRVELPILTRHLGFTAVPSRRVPFPAANMIAFIICAHPATLVEDQESPRLYQHTTHVLRDLSRTLETKLHKSTPNRRLVKLMRTNQSR